MKEPRRSRTFRRLALVTSTLIGGQVAAGRVVDAWALSLPQAWALVLMAVVGLWILWRALGLDAAARRRRRLLRHRLSDLDRLSGAAFEDWVAAVLETSGFRIESTPRTGDYGVDLIAVRDGTRIGIEAKRHARPISNRVVRSVVAGCQFHGCERAAVVTQSRFTDRAVAQAERAEVDVVLVGRDDLHRLGELLIP